MVVGFVIGSVASGFAFSAVLDRADGWIGRLPPYLASAANAMTSENPRRDECMRDVDGKPRGGLDFCALGGASRPGTPVMMLWGDSFADMIQPVVDRAADGLGVPGIVATQGGCPPWRGKVFPGSARVPKCFRAAKATSCSTTSKRRLPFGSW